MEEEIEVAKLENGKRRLLQGTLWTHRLALGMFGILGAVDDDDNYA